MKKILSLLLSLLMLALPVFSCAESAATSYSIQDVYMRAPTTRYTAQGQEEITTVTLSAGEGLAAFIPDESTLTAVKDLLDALTIQLKTQMTEGNMQGGLGLLLNGEDAVNLLLSSTPNGLFATSNLLNGQIYGLSNEEFGQLFEQILQSATQNGEGGSLETITLDPNAMLADMDMTALQESFTALLANVKAEEVTEAPEVLPEATQLVTITVKKADLVKCFEEVGKFIFSIPSFRQILAMSSGVEEKDLDTAPMVADITSVAESVKDDFDVYIYTDATGTSQYGNTVIPISPVEGEDAELEKHLDVEYLNRNTDGTQFFQVLLSTIVADSAQSLSLTSQTTDGALAVDCVISQKEGEEVSTPVSIHYEGNYSVTEEKCAATILTTFLMQVAPEQFITLSSVDEYENTDMGDHAESSENVTISIEGLGELLSIRRSSVTGLAEAYLNENADVIHPMAMTEEERTELGQSLITTLQTSLITVLTKLPESVLTLMNGGTGAAQ